MHALCAHVCVPMRCAPTCTCPCVVRPRVRAHAFCAHMCVLVLPPLQPIENQHQATSKSLAILRTLKAPIGCGNHTCRVETSSSKEVEQPLNNGDTYMPHFAHMHHYGWNPPTPKVKCPIEVRPL